jgi:hypothetical protein
MITYEYKLQGNGKDSWTATETNDIGEVIAKYMVYEDPNKIKKIDLKDIDIDTMSQSELEKLANKLKPLLK